MVDGQRPAHNCISIRLHWLATNHTFAAEASTGQGTSNTDALPDPGLRSGAEAYTLPQSGAAPALHIVG